MEELEEIVGTVEGIIFRNEENGYTVAAVEAGDEVHTVVGLLPTLREGERVALTGTWGHHASYGQQFKVEMCRTLPPDTRAGLIRYLASGAIEGVGPVTAQRIVDAFGMDALDVIHLQPDRLTRVEGIGRARAHTISESLARQQDMQQVMVFFGSLSLSMGLTTKLYKMYGPLAIEVVRSDPYRLVRDIEGVGFKTADRIAGLMGVAADSTRRLDAALIYLLQEAASSQGHTCVPRAELIRAAVKLVEGKPEALDREIVELLGQQELVSRLSGGNEYIYLPRFLEAEQEVAGKLRRLLGRRPAPLYENDEAVVDSIARRDSIDLAKEQKEAILSVLQNGVTIITGGPGTGKTTAVRCLMQVLEQARSRAVLAAPTGRAAKRMTEATGYEAKTIHRLLEYGFGSGEDELLFARNEEHPLECDTLIVDEMSMVDLMLMQHLLRAVKPGCRLVLVGDADQLPSVGAGNVLRDIIDWGAAPAIRLTVIFRQAKQSLIVVNAHRVNHGEMPELGSKDQDFFFEGKQTPEDVLKSLLSLVRDRISGFIGCDSLADIQVMAPMKKGDLGVHSLNAALQQMFNPPDPRRPERAHGDVVFRQGDKVMQIKNNYRLAWRRALPGGGQEDGEGVFNGDVGFIESIDTEGRMLTLRFDDDRTAEYDFTQLDELMLAYAISIHKSQGSEFPVVVLPLWGGTPMLFTRNLLYTAITRARQMVVIIGRKECVAAMVSNNKVTQRFSGLLEALVDEN